MDNDLIFDLVSTYEFMYEDYQENYLTVLLFATNYNIRQRHARHIIATGKLITENKFNLN